MGKAGLDIPLHGFPVLAGQPEEQAAFVKVCGNFSRITGSDALVQITLPKKGIKGFHADFDFYQDVQTGEGGPKGFDGRSVLPVTFEVNLFDAFADADFPDQIHGLLIKVRKTSGVDDLQLLIDSRDFCQFYLI